MKRRTFKKLVALLLRAALKRDYCKNSVLLAVSQSLKKVVL